MGHAVKTEVVHAENMEIGGRMTLKCWSELTHTHASSSSTRGLTLTYIEVYATREKRLK